MFRAHKNAVIARAPSSTASCVHPMTTRGRVSEMPCQDEEGAAAAAAAPVASATVPATPKPTTILTMQARTMEIIVRGVGALDEEERTAVLKMQDVMGMKLAGELGGTGADAEDDTPATEALETFNRRTTSLVTMQALTLGMAIRGGGAFSCEERGALLGMQAEIIKKLAVELDDQTGNKAAASSSVGSKRGVEEVTPASALDALPDVIWQDTVKFLSPPDMFAAMCTSKTLQRFTDPHKSVYKHENTRRPAVRALMAENETALLLLTYLLTY